MVLINFALPPETRSRFFMASRKYSVLEVKILDYVQGDYLEELEQESEDLQQVLINYDLLHPMYG